MTDLDAAVADRPRGHAHRHRSGPELTHDARHALETRGEQWTQLRGAVFDVLAGFGRPASAYDVADQLSRRENRRVAANSVYRILDLFVASNLAHRIESASAYIVNPHPGCVHDCIFLVCDGCGETQHLDDDAIAEQVRGAAAGAGFRPERPVIEVHGRCADCATAAAPRDRH